MPSSAWSRSSNSIFAFPNTRKATLTKIKSAIVSRRTWRLRFAEEMKFGDFVFLGKGMTNQATIPSNLLADLYESLVGAVYLDGGLEAARTFILQASLIPEIEEVAEAAHAGHFKSVLQQLAQKEFAETPIYKVLDEKGPDHSKCFKIAALIGRYHYAAAWGRNKKEAEQKAAMNAIAQINGEEIPFKVD